MRHSRPAAIVPSRRFSEIIKRTHSRSRRTFFAKALLAGLVGLGGAAAPAAAQINLYDSEDVAIDFGLDAATVAFAQSNPWFGEPEANIGVDTNNWAEIAVEPQLYVTLKNVFGGELSAGLSAVATMTYGESADGFAAGIDDPGKATLEKLYVGWKTDLGGDDFFEIIGGDFDYEIGTGFLIKDGGRDGGDRGGFYLGARSASRSSGLVRVQKGDLLLEGFWLGNNPGRGGIKAHVGGINAEYDLSEGASIGATYIEVAHFDDAVTASTAEELKTYDVRASVDVTNRLTLSGEYALQDGASFYEGNGWYLQGDYTLGDLRFEPTLTYRYAVVTGDDPTTPQNEEFVPLAYGFTDYGQWYQGEITGNWIFGNSNQKTHMIKGSAALTETVSLTASWLNFTLDEPGQIGVTDEAFGNEIDVILDWQATDRLFLSAAAAVMMPSDGATQFTGGDETWSHIMFYASVAF
ncbi:MAG TPA: hypothetical protein DHV57_15485 [Hyphomonas sp.]|jgi:hypothetical protein|uniref:hypothetical protein n=1 Tax=uncultured Hyphomonas sp. TaxID=225298 RepID=UPI000C62AC91|nr:hypothetical protein [Hyphomonas sp.]MAN91646.1 hypothetical protein [Hyphomonadaceae bacterium]HBL93770.1 hypothetical protein [Hyphomonas sp.]HCJ18810.1 hypothetical protein [Hyphomonas sp.]|tara:strand:+ start:63840 stop:65234 length:1395 start_codon:yes stop_codon:yes gene_type:complete